VGADQQRLKRGFATRASANNVPRGINIVACGDRQSLEESLSW
jgi:hypothetical protein